MAAKKINCTSTQLRRWKKVAIKCLKKGDWLLDHVERELTFMRGADFRR
jgi:hypothetical protein